MFRIGDLTVVLNLDAQHEGSVEKLRDKLAEKLTRLSELIEEIAWIIDEELFNACEVYVYPDNYMIKYTVSPDGAKILHIKHRTVWDDT